MRALKNNKQRVFLAFSWNKLNNISKVSRNLSEGRT